MGNLGFGGGRRTITSEPWTLHPRVWTAAQGAARGARGKGPLAALLVKGSDDRRARVEMEEVGEDDE